MQEELYPTCGMIGDMPIAIYGTPSESVFLYVHGLCGCKEDAEPFARIADARGWQTLSVDLPQHGKRQDSAKLLPWIVVPELQKALKHAQAHWKRIAVYGCSIGAWMALQAFADYDISICLLASPLFDMETMILGMMRTANVTEARLKAEREIPTSDGQTLSWDYLCWARQHPVRALCANTAILYGSCDALIPRHTVERFAAENHCALTVQNGAQHWMHTNDELNALRAWESRALDSRSIVKA